MKKDIKQDIPLQSGEAKFVEQCGEFGLVIFREEKKVVEVWLPGKGELAMDCIRRSCVSQKDVDALVESILSQRHLLKEV